MNPLLGLGLAGAALVIWALSRIPVYLRVGAAYKAKVLCTAIFGSGRRLDPQSADQVTADSYWILRPFTAHVDGQRRTVTASCLGRFPRTAVFREGLGATLVSRVSPTEIGRAHV